MDTARRNKHVLGNKLDDIQLSSFSSSDSSAPSIPDASIPDASNSDATKSSLLVDMSNSVSIPIPYDLTLIDLDVTSYPEKVPAADKAGAG